MADLATNSDIGVVEENLTNPTETALVNEVQSKKEDEIPLRHENKSDTQRTADNDLIKNPGSYEEERMAETVRPVPLEQIPRIIRRRIPSPLYIPHFNYTDKAFFSGLILVTVLSFGTRLYKLSEPHHVA